MGRMANIKMCSPVPLPLSDERFYYLIAAALYVENITIMEQHDRSLSHTLCTVQICFVVLLLYLRLLHDDVL